MAMNKMNILLSKIERRLGTKPLMLPEDINKDNWAEEIIIPDTIATFSRYFPHMVRIKVPNTPDNKKNGYYVINTDLIGGAEILGVKDIAWDIFGECGLVQQSGIGINDYMSTYNNYSMDDVMLLQARADMTSVFNTSIFVDFQEPNLIKLQSATHGDITGGMSDIPMDTFENLATADVASALVAYLQHYDGLETVFANVDLKLNYLENWASKREDIVRYLDDCHVNPANKNQ